MPAIPTTQEAEIRRRAVRSQPPQIVQETLFQKYPSPRAGGVGQAPVLPRKRKEGRKKERIKMTI
jgi:hypothetical protein